MDDTLLIEGDESPPVRELTRTQRRVLGVLVEKGFTTPEYYPLTLKAVTTGCNQKSNRDPVTNYSEDAVEETLEELRQLGLVAVVHTESGRTERFRHFMRKRYPFSEPQLAIVTELLLRGRQQLGELRSRASRMVPIETQEELREHLLALADAGYVRASGPLERRGIEVDHAFHRPNEVPTWGTTASADTADAGSHRSHPAGQESPVRATAAPLAAATPTAVAAPLTAELQNLRVEVEQLSSRVAELADELAELKRSLGV